MSRTRRSTRFEPIDFHHPESPDFWDELALWSAPLRSAPVGKWAVTIPATYVEARMPACSSGHVDVVGVGRDPFAELVLGAGHLRVVALDVLAREPDELLVVGTLEAVPAGTIDRAHGSLLRSPGRGRPRSEGIRKMT